VLIPFDVLCRKYSINPKGVLHIGANNAAECESYYANGVEKTCWIEALPDIFEEMKEVVSHYPNAIPLKACISDVDFKDVIFNVSSNHGESSSLLEFGTHSTHHSDITFVDKIRMITIRVDTLLNRKQINVRNYDFLNLDLQGSELSALKSMGDMLRLFRYVYIEINRDDVYVGCAKVDEVEAYLSEFGFELKEAKWTGAGWGDGFFIKRNDMNSVFTRRNIANKFREGMVEVPNEFMTQMPFCYPDDNVTVFEKWYLDDFNEPTERLYLPVQFTGYHVRHNFGNDLNAIAKLQKYIDGLDRSKKYYTIHQFDLGCMVDFKDLDILVFGMAGGRIDYCLPLLCMPHKFEFDNPKTLFASFVGRHTHPVREVVFNSLRHKQGCYVSDAKHDLSSYCSILSSSVFGLAMRGFGNNSFRLQECLQYGAIPVIISNERLEPHGIRFEEYGVYIDEKDAGNVYEILQSLTVDEVTEKQSKLKYYYDTFFSYSGTKKIILEQLKK
jgi:FkbM family methyltransferase